MSAPSAASAIDAHAASSAFIPSPSRTVMIGCCMELVLQSLGRSVASEETPSPPATRQEVDLLTPRRRNVCSPIYAGRTS